ncbi:MAG: sulfotransferase family protein [Promethearchaeota archaeon]
MNKKIDKYINSPIFIVGAPRSGTTLIANILSRHSKIFIPGETHFFDDIYSLRKKLGNPSNPSSMTKIIKRLSTLYKRYNEPLDQERINHLFSDHKILNKFKFSCKNYRDIFSFFMEIQMRHEGKQRWGNHTPRDIFNIKDILSFYPNAKILVCVRDARDFLLSYKYKWRVTSIERIESLKKIYHPVVTSLLWKSSMRQISAIRTKMGNDNLMIIKYENLVQNPEEVVYKICKFIGEKFEKRMLEVNSHNSSFQVRDRGIFSSSVGRWRGSLAKEEAYVAQLINRRELESFGYQIEKIQVNLLKVIKIFMSFPFGLWRALKVTKGRRGSLISYIFRRVESFLYSK